MLSLDCPRASDAKVTLFMLLSEKMHRRKLELNSKGGKCSVDVADDLPQMLVELQLLENADFQWAWGKTTTLMTLIEDELNDQEKLVRVCISEPSVFA